MDKEELKQEFLESVAAAEEKKFEIKKIKLSDDDPVIQLARRFVNAPADPSFRYPGLRAKPVIKVVQTPGKFFGIRIGPIRIGVFIENGPH